MSPLCWRYFRRSFDQYSVSVCIDQIDIVRVVLKESIEESLDEFHDNDLSYETNMVTSGFFVDSELFEVFERSVEAVEYEFIAVSLDILFGFFGVDSELDPSIEFLGSLIVEHAIPRIDVGVKGAKVDIVNVFSRVESGRVFDVKTLCVMESSSFKAQNVFFFFES